MARHQAAHGRRVVLAVGVEEDQDGRARGGGARLERLAVAGVALVVERADAGSRCAHASHRAPEPSLEPSSTRITSASAGRSRSSSASVRSSPAASWKTGTRTLNAVPTSGRTPATRVARRAPGRPPPAGRAAPGSSRPRARGPGGRAPGCTGRASGRRRAPTGARAPRPGAEQVVNQRREAAERVHVAHALDREAGLAEQAREAPAPVAAQVPHPVVVGRPERAQRRDVDEAASAGHEVRVERAHRRRIVRDVLEHVGGDHVVEAPPVERLERGHAREAARRELGAQAGIGLHAGDLEAVRGEPCREPPGARAEVEHAARGARVGEREREDVGVVALGALHHVEQVRGLVGAVERRGHRRRDRRQSSIVSSWYFESVSSRRPTPKLTAERIASPAARIARGTWKT